MKKHFICLQVSDDIETLENRKNDILAKYVYSGFQVSGNTVKMGNVTIEYLVDDAGISFGLLQEIREEC